MVIARNDPDQARHVVVMVPGVGAGVDTLDTYTRRSEDLFRKLASHHEDDTICVITWLDYVAPKSSAQARDAGHADAGAYRLAVRLIDLAVTAEFHGRWGVPARTTVVAHGYGGLVAGLAAREHGLKADALVLIGCPGIGVESVRELQFDGQVFATPSDTDGDGTPIGVHGPPPDSPGFGTTVLRPGPLSYRGDPVVRYLPELRRVVLGQT